MRPGPLTAFPGKSAYEGGQLERSVLLRYGLVRPDIGQTLAQDPILQDQFDRGMPELAILCDEAFQDVGRLAGRGLAPLEDLETRHGVDPRKNNVDQRLALTSVSAEWFVDYRADVVPPDGLGWESA